jgi:hypothetical protein
MRKYQLIQKKTFRSMGFEQCRTEFELLLQADMLATRLPSGLIENVAFVKSW